MFLVPAFFITALLYALVGFGGGSTYSALLALAGTDYRIMPILALVCNIIVVSGGTFRFYRAGHFELRRAVPWVIASVPAAWLGGSIEISERFFTGLLGAVLLLAGLQILFRFSETGGTHDMYPVGRHPFLPFTVGAVLGFLAGAVGIGGGIFLAPVLYLLRWGNARNIAGMCSFFILVNSLSGLAGQLMKIGDAAFFMQMEAYLWLFPAVFVGGQIGARMGAVRLDPKIIRILTALLILYAATQMLWRWQGML